MAESFAERRRRELGLTPTTTKAPTPTHTSSTKTVEKPKESEFVSRRKIELGLTPDPKKIEGAKQVASFKQSEQKFGHISANPADSQVMQIANKYAADNPTWKNIAENPISRVAGKALGAVGKVYDKVSHLPVINQATGLMQGAVEPFVRNDTTNVDEPLWKKIAGNVKDAAHIGQMITNPSLVATDLFKNKSLKDAGKSFVEAPVSAIKGAFNPDEARKNLEDSLKSKSLVTKLAVGSLADPLSYVPVPSIKGIKTASTAVSEAFEKFAARNKEVPATFEHFQQAAKSRNELSLGEIDRGEQGIVDRFNFMEKQTNKNQPLQLPEPKTATMAREAERRSVLEPSNRTILGRGDVETFALPESNTPRIISDIKKQANAIIKPPTSRRDLLAYTEQHLEIPRTELVEMTDKDLYQLGQMIRTNTNMDALHAKLAAEQGHNWTELVSGKSVTGNVEAPLNRIQDVRPPAKPALVGAREGDVIVAPKVRKTPTLKEVATKPRVEPVNGTVTQKTTVKPTLKEAVQPDPIVAKTAELKPVSDVRRTLTPSQKVVGERATYRNMLDNGGLSAKLNATLERSNKNYNIVTDEEAVLKANKNVENVDEATSKYMGNEKPEKEDITTAILLMKKLDDLGDHEKALNLQNKLYEDLTRGGQTVQAASLIGKLSPEGQLLNLLRKAKANNKTVTVTDSIEFKAKAKIVREKSGAGVRANQFTEILDRAAKGEKLTPDDIQKMSDYLASAEKAAKPKVVKVVDDLPEEMKVPRKRDKIISYLDDAEQAALARIAARKGKVSVMVLPNLAEWADHSIVVAAQITKGSIKAATHIEDLVKLFGEDIRPVATQVFQKAQSLVKSVSPGISANDITKANKAFERISGQAKEMNQQEKVVEKYLKENQKVSPKDIDTLRELAKNVTKLSSEDGVKADIAMQKILNSYEKSNAWDKVQAVRYMSMLLNSGTQLVNAASGPIMATKGAIGDVFGTMVDIAMHQTLKTPRSVTMYGTNPLRFMADYFKHLIKTGAPAGWHGVSPGGIQNAGEIRGLTFKSNYNPLNWAERTLGAVAKGADYATYKTIFDSEIRKSGFLDAINSGIKRSDRAAIKAHVEKFVNEPTEAALLDADRIGKNTTFQRSDSTGGKVANFLASGPAVTKPVIGAIIPFVRTPINMASSAVSMTPAGILKGLWQLTSKSKASQREAIRTLSLGVTGTFGTSALGYYLSNIGIITGANDSGDKNVDAIREQAGKGKYRFNTSGLKRYLSSLLNGDGADAAEKAAKYQEGDHAFDYNKFQPIAFPLAIGASLQENKSKSLIGRVGSAGADAYGSLFGMSTLKGVQDVFQPQYTGTQGEKQLGVASRVAESFFKSFSPSMLAQEARRQDPIARKTPYNNGFKEDVKGYFKSRTPGLSESLPANKTTLGMNKQNAAGFGGQYVNPYKSEIAAYSSAAVIISDLIDKTGDKSLAPKAPEKNAEGKDKKTGEQVSIAIPQDRYEQMQEELGHEIILKITALDSSLSDAKKVDKIKEIYTKARKKEMNKVKTELGIRVDN